MLFSRCSVVTAHQQISTILQWSARYLKAGSDSIKPFSLNTKKQITPPNKTQNNPQIVQGLTDVGIILIAASISGPTQLSSLRAFPQWQPEPCTRAKALFASLRRAWSAQLSWHIQLSLSSLGFNSRAVWAGTDGAAADRSPSITAPRRDQGILSLNRHQILQVFYSDIFKGTTVLGTWLLSTWRLIIPSAFQVLPLLPPETTNTSVKNETDFGKPHTRDTNKIRTCKYLHRIEILLINWYYWD